jgi:hypothetical protein
MSAPSDLLSGTTAPQSSGTGVAQSIGPLVRVQRIVQRNYQSFLDQTAPWLKSRWATTLALFLLFIVRVYYLSGWYIVTYALGIYMLNLLIAFLTPQIDPEMESENSGLPTQTDDEFKPFIRRLPEFKFWYVVLFRKEEKSLQRFKKKKKRTSSRCPVNQKRYCSHRSSSLSYNRRTLVDP